MRRFVHSVVGLAVALAIAVPAYAADETLTGTLMCALCTLKKADAKECQDILVVTKDDKSTIEYYVVKNEVTEKAGEACTVKIPVTITGTVSEKDGKKWVTPTKIEKTP